MQILLQILAVIGIILLCIIGIVLLVSCLVLFVPIRYRIYAQKEAELLAELRLSWLLHFITLKYEYPDPQELVLRIFGFKVNLKTKEEKTEVAQKEEAKGPEEPEEVRADESVKTGENEKENTKQIPEKILTEANAGPESGQTEKENRKETDEKKDLLQNILFKIKEIYDKIKKIIGEVRYYWELLQKKENRLLLERCKKWLGKILKNIKPKVLSIDAIIGTGAPDTTGYILAVYGMLSPLYGYQINIVPDFDNKIFEGKILVKGKITIFILLYYIIRIYFDKQMQKLIEILKRKE